MLEELYDKDPDKYDPIVFQKEQGIVLLVIDDFNAFRQKAGYEEQDLLKTCLELGEESGVCVLIADTTGALSYPASDEILKLLTKNASGLSLGSFESLDTYYNQAKVAPGEKTSVFPPGRGYLVTHGTGRIVQTATYSHPEEDPQESLRARVTSLK